MSIGMALGGCSNFAGSSCGRRGAPENRCPQSFDLLRLAISRISCAQLLLGSVTVPASWLPVGLPWVGAHFRMDALAALFFVIV